MKNRLHPTPSLACLLLSTFMILSPAQADLITFSDTHLLSPTDWADTLTVSQFDAALGTLNSVMLTFTAGLLSDMTMDNDNLTAVAARGTVELLVLGQFVGLGPLSLNFSDMTGFVSLAADDSGDTDLPGDGGPDEATIVNLSGSGALSATLTSVHADFASFIGVGNLSTMGLQTFGGFGILGGGGNIDANLNTRAEAALTVVYEFTPFPTGPGPSVPTPEPGTLVLLGTGFFGWLGVKRRGRTH